VGKLNALRLKSLIVPMRYSGMRISDAVTLTTDRIDGKRLFLHTLKTGVPVYTVLRNAEDARRPLHGPCTRFTFGAGSLGLKVLPDCGRSAPRNSSVWQESQRVRAMQFPIASAIRLAWRCYLPAYQSSGYPFCSDIRACRSLRSITTTGYAPAKSSWRLMSRGLGNSIQF